MNLRNHIEYSATASLLGLCRILPEAWVYALFKSFALLFFCLSKNRRNLSLRNLQIVFPEKSKAEQKQIAKQAFVNFSESLAFNALIMSGRISNEQMLECVEAGDWDRFEKLMADSTHGVLFLSGHIGNWELMAQYLSFRAPKPLHAIARKGNNPLLEERVVLPLRNRFGMQVVYKKKAVLKLVKILKRNELTGLMLDQRLSLPQGIKVDFFGREANTTPTPATLQIRFKPTTLPIFLVHTDHRKYRFIVGDPIHWEDNGKPQNEQILELTRIHQKIIEDIIRQYPDQWFWMHNRWGLKKGEL